jgi:hypothetical protein
MSSLNDVMIDTTNDNVYKIKPYERETLEAVGITRLTGEACALSMRLLCELTEDAMRLYLELTGINCDFNTIRKSNWNDSDKYSVFLTRDAIYRMVIMAYAKIGYAMLEVLDKDSNNVRFLLAADNIGKVNQYVFDNKKAYGYYDESIGDYGAWVDGYAWKTGRRYTIYSAQPRRGLSNVHAMTGISQ